MDMRHNPRKPVFVVVFNGRLEDGCDYATQTIRLLARTGHVYGWCLGEPISWRTTFSCRALPIIEKRFGVIIFRPVFLIPGQRNYFIRITNYAVNAVALSIYIALIHPHAKKFFWFFEPFYMPTLLRIFFPYVTIFDCVDYFFAFPYPFVNHLLFSLQRSTYVFVNSFTLRRQIQRYRSDATVVPLGFSSAGYKRKEIMKETRHQIFRVGFIGGIDDRLDYQLLFQVATALPDIEFMFVGRNYYVSTGFPPRAQSFFSLANVRHREEVAKSLIPTVLTTFDIGIIPYNIKQSFNRFCFPMKTLEYFFAGLPVVSTNIEEIRKYRDLIAIVNTPQEMIGEINKIKKYGLSKKKRLKAQRTALNNSWVKKINTIEKVIFSDPR